MQSYIFSITNVQYLWLFITETAETYTFLRLIPRNVAIPSQTINLFKDSKNIYDSPANINLSFANISS